MEKVIVTPKDLKLETVELSGKDSTGKEYSVKACIVVGKGGQLIFDNFSPLEDDLKIKSIMLPYITHYICEKCNKEFPKEKQPNYNTDYLCETCRRVKEEEEYRKREDIRYSKMVEVDECDFPVFYHDYYYNDEDDLLCQLSDNFFDSGLTINDFRNVLDKEYVEVSEVQHIPYLSISEFLDDNFEANEDNNSCDYFNVDHLGRGISELEKEVNDSLNEMYDKRLYTTCNKKIKLSKLIDIEKLIKEITEE